MSTSGNTLSLIKSVVRSTTGQALGRVANFLIPFVILNNYKPSAVTDSFFFALSIGFLFWGTISNSITDASVPALAQKNIILKITQRNIVGFLVSLVSVVLLIVWGLADNDAILSVPLLVGVFLSTLSSVISSFVVAILNVQNHYVLPGLLWGLRIIPLLVFWKLSPNVIYLPWLMAGIGLSDILRARCLYSKVKLDGVLSVDWREVFRGYAAVAIGSIVVGMNPIVDRLIAGLGQPGDLSILELGERIFGIVGSLSTIGIMSVLLVEFSDRVKLGDLSRYFQKILVVFLGWSCLWLLFIYSFWYLLEGRIFAFLKLTDLQYQLVTLIFFNYLGGLPAFIVGLVCVRGFLSIGKAEVIAVLAVVSLGVNALLSYVLNSLLGVSGIALATSIVTTVITITMIILLSNSRYV